MSWELARLLVPADPRIGNGSGALRGLPGTATSPAPSLALALSGFGPRMFCGSRSSCSRSTDCSAMSSLPFPSPPALQGLGAGSPSAWLAVSRPSARGPNTRNDVAPSAVVAVSYGGFMAPRPSGTAWPYCSSSSSRTGRMSRSTSCSGASPGRCGSTPSSWRCSAHWSGSGWA